VVCCAVIVFTANYSLFLCLFLRLQRISGNSALVKLSAGVMSNIKLSALMVVHA